LGIKRSLHLVRLGDQVLVVGQHEQGLTAVTTVPLSSLPDLEASLAAEAAQVPTEVAGQPGTTPAPTIPPQSSAFAHAFTQAVQTVLGRESR
jgi:flagellar biogenesis protein FliO